LPCGTLIKITYRGRSVVAPVVDRGPYMAYPRNCNIYKRSEWVRCRRIRLRLPVGWSYRACIDMTPATARALGHNGWARVTIEWTPRKRVVRR
jgi:hypothetical protein